MRSSSRCCTEFDVTCSNNSLKDGWRMRVYIPFGTEWYPYLMRRLAERPANALFIAKNLFR